ncbi:MAG: IS66 family transposase [Saprospiraceae bacterium]|nr:IS66 family transposase [Saprospiraceae bacterium]
MYESAYINTVNYASLKRSDHLQLLREKDEKIRYLSFELEQIKRALFGSKSERFVSSTTAEQLELFTTLQRQLAEVHEEQISYKRKKVKRKPKRTKLPEHLERVVTIMEPEVNVNAMQKMGEAIQEKLALTPAKLYVKKTVQPLYRQSKIWNRQSIDLSRSTMCGIIRKGAELLEPLYEAMTSMAMNSNYLMADESSIPVLHKDQKDSKALKGCMLVKVAPQECITIMEYIKTKEKINLLSSLQSFKGHLQVDGNVSYEDLDKKQDMHLMHCLVHSRRYFEKALDYDRVKAQQMLAKIQQLYKIERSTKGQTTETILYARQTHAQPILDDIKNWLEENLVHSDPPNPMQRAIRYMLKRWKGLTKYIDAGHLRPDNNLIENQIRPLALGRKNYLFAGSDRGAHHAAIFYSFFATCKMNGLNPFEWLQDVYTRISEHPINQINLLIPIKDYPFLKW